MSYERRDGAEMTIEELAERADVPIRTIRYYVSEGLLAGPEGRGKATRYGPEHLLRLQLIRRLVEQRLPLAEIRARLAGLSFEEVRALLEEARQTSEQARAAAAVSPKEYVSALLRRARSEPARVRRQEPPAFAAPPAPPAPSQPTAGPSARQSASPESWRHWELAPGVELHVRADAETRERDLIERLMRAITTERKP